MRLFLVLIMLVFASKGAASNQFEKYHASPLIDTDNFLIYYVFADSALEEPLKKEMINHLKEFGIVYPGDDNKLTKEQKEMKYKIGQPILNVIVSSIIEESTEVPSSYKTLPVIELTLQVKSGVQVIENGSQIPGIIWEGRRYISSMDNKRKFIEKARKNLGFLLDAFKTDYQKTNPNKNEKKPQFYLYL